MSFKESLQNYSKYLRSIVSLSDHVDAEAAMANIQGNIAFRGPNVFILFFAIIIASLGLNVNSIPVIIGAMLISPLMGPIIGFGLGLGTNDTDLVADSLRNLLVMVIISIIASTLYFVLTPLDMVNPTELLARTNPTVYDIMIAFFGGLAGIVEISRKDKGTVMSGVAIATALMPPLCTVGYGIAQLNWHYALGALYLFFINSIFIALATFIVVKYLRFPLKDVENNKKAKRQKWIVYVILIIIIIPGTFSTIDIVKDNNVQRAANHLISDHKAMGKSYIYDFTVDTSSDPAQVHLYIAGEPLPGNQREQFLQDAEQKGFLRSQIVFHEDAVTEGFNQEELVRDIFDYHEKQLREKQTMIDSLQQQLLQQNEQIDSLRQLLQSMKPTTEEE